MAESNFHKIIPRIGQQEKISKIFPLKELLKNQEKIQSQLIEPILSKKFTEFISSIPVTSKNAEKKQKNIVRVVVEDPTLTDYATVCKRLNQEQNADWKLNPDDIADFYLLERFIKAHGSQVEDDSVNLAILKAKAMVSEIGKKLLVALAHEQLEEYDRFVVARPDALPEELKRKLDQSLAEVSIELATDTYLSDFKTLLGDHPTSQDLLKIFENKDMFDTALRILETQQGGRWGIMATAMRCLLDKSYPVASLLRKLVGPSTDPATLQQMEEAIGDDRELFLIDRLFNYIHNTGIMFARVTNNIPRSTAMLLAHGLPKQDQYLFHNSSFIYGSDILSRKLRSSLSSQDRDVTEDMVCLVHSNTLPREFSYALLLELDNPKIKKAVSEKTLENLSPSHVYRLLKAASQHDGKSKGRIK